MRNTDAPLYLIAYDIRNPRRLGRVARRLEKSALRVQKSVFLFCGARTVLVALLSDVRQLIHPSEDRVQAWRLSASTPPSGSISVGQSVYVAPAGAVIANGSIYLIGDGHERRF